MTTAMGSGMEEINDFMEELVFFSVVDGEKLGILQDDAAEVHGVWRHIKRIVIPI